MAVNIVISPSEDVRTVSADFPFESKYLDVFGSKMHYVDEGQGETILFLHGNPAAAYLWRNIIPHVTAQARCVAVDLIGMGKSDHPAISYTYDEQYKYLCEFIAKLGIGTNLTLFVQDWGSGLGFRWCADHPESVRALVFIEAMVRPMSYSDLPGSLKVSEWNRCFRRSSRPAQTSPARPAERGTSPACGLNMLGSR